MWKLESLDVVIMCGMIKFREAWMDDLGFAGFAYAVCHRAQRLSHTAWKP